MALSSVQFGFGILKASRLGADTAAQKLQNFVGQSRDCGTTATEASSRRGRYLKKLGDVVWT
jgi:hypothetical protein